MDCPVLWLLLDNELLSGRGGVTRFGKWGVRWTRERVQIGWRFNSANRKKQIDKLVVSPVHMNWGALKVSSLRFLWLSCDLILRPNSDDMSVYSWWNALFSSPLESICFLWWATQVLDSFPSVFVCLSLRELIYLCIVPHITIWLICEPILHKGNEVKPNRQVNKHKKEKEWECFLKKKALVQNLHPFVTRGKYDHHNDMKSAFSFSGIALVLLNFLSLSEAKISLKKKKRLPSLNALKWKVLQDRYVLCSAISKYDTAVFEEAHPT